MNDEQVPGDAIADAPEPVTQLFRAARGPAAADETAGLDAMLAAFGIGAPSGSESGATVVAVGAARSRRRRVLVGGIVATLAVTGVGVAAAGSGSLPAPVQRVASSLAERVGVDLPSPDDDSVPEGGRPHDNAVDSDDPVVTTPSGVTPPGLNGQPDVSAPPSSTPSGVAPDEQQVTGWCRSWVRGKGSGASMEAASRQRLLDEAAGRGVDADVLCASLGVTSVPATTKPEPTRPTNPSRPTTSTGHGNGKDDAGSENAPEATSVP